MPRMKKFALRFEWVPQLHHVLECPPRHPPEGLHGTVACMAGLQECGREGQMTSARYTTENEEKAARLRRRCWAHHAFPRTIRSRAHILLRSLSMLYRQRIFSLGVRVQAWTWRGSMTNTDKRPTNTEKKQADRCARLCRGCFDEHGGWACLAKRASAPASERDVHTTIRTPSRG